jgi:hypothetical protein
VGLPGPVLCTVYVKEFSSADAVSVLVFICFLPIYYRRHGEDSGFVVIQEMVSGPHKMNACA